MRSVIPLQIKTLPPVFEKRIKAYVVVFVRRLDALQLRQMQSLIAKHLPIVLQFLQFRQFIQGHEWFGSDFGAPHHQSIDGRQNRRVVKKHFLPSSTHTSSVMPIQNGGYPENNQSPFHKFAYSHSIVAGGLLLTSITTLLIPRTSLMMRPDTFLSKP